jgi:hypothetical protein
MDAALLAKALGAGFATGISCMSIATIILLPASYMMNKFVYHSMLMRLMLGGAASVLSIFAIGYIVIKLLSGSWGKVHYFGLAPIFRVTENPVAPEGYLSFFFRILFVFTHPLTMFYVNKDDDDGYKNSIEQMLLPKPIAGTANVLEATLDGSKLLVQKGAVCEEFTLAAQKAGFLSKGPWKTRMGELEATGIGAHIFTPSAT